MKQKTLLKHLFLLIALVVGGVSNAWADVSTLTFTAACGGSGTADDGAEWTVASDGTESNYDSTKGIHYGTSSGQVQYITLSTSDITGTITKVVVNASTANGVSATVSVTIDGSAFGGDAQSLTSSAADYTFNGSASGEIIVTVTKPEKATKALYVKSVAVTYTSGGGSTTVSNPSFKFGTGTYTTAQNEELSCTTDGATIHYTMTVDGTTPDDPTESDATYSSAISVTKSGTIIKAKAFKSGMTASSVVSATYTIKPNKPTITGGASVTITGDAGCTFYYTTATGSANPTDPTNESTKYTAPFTPADGTKIKAVAYDAYGNKSDATSVFTFKYMPLAPKNIGSNYYVKVTDVNKLENGDAVLIVCESHNYALSTTQNNNNRGEKAVTISDGVIKNPDATVQKLTLVKKTETISDVATDVFYFYTGSGYLYAASNSSNHLKTEDVPDNNNNARATISISSGNATILFTGTNSRKWLKHNNSSGIFACYATTDATQCIVQLYKEVSAVTVTDAMYATYVTSEDIDFAASTGVKAYKATSATGKIVLEEVTAAKKGTPLVIAASENTYQLALAASTPADVEGNLLEASDGSIVGTATNSPYVLGKNGAWVGFAPLAEGTTLAAGKAYIPANLVSGAKDFLPFAFDDASETDGINQPTTYDLQHASIYNLAGQRVGNDYKGIVIINGKKYLNK